MEKEIQDMRRQSAPYDEIMFIDSLSQAANETSEHMTSVEIKSTVENGSAAKDFFIKTTTVNEFIELKSEECICDEPRLFTPSLDQKPARSSIKGNRRASKSNQRRSSFVSSGDQLNVCQNLTVNSKSASFKDDFKTSRRQRKSSAVHGESMRSWKRSQNYSRNDPSSAPPGHSKFSTRILKPNDYFFFSVFTTIFCFFPLGNFIFEASIKIYLYINILIFYQGLVGLFFSVKSAKAFHSYRFSDSIYYSTISYRMNLTAFAVGMSWFIFVLGSLFYVLYKVLDPLKGF
jgi:hypothetical protein